MSPWARSVLSSCLAACFYLSIPTQALRTGQMPAPHKLLTVQDASRSELYHAGTQSNKVALLLRGEICRAGWSNRRLIAFENHTNVQRANYQSHLEKVVYPFEKAGYQVDIITSTYTSPYDYIFNEYFGDRIKVFQKLIWHKNECQASNAKDNMAVLMDYANRTNTTYRWVIFGRHDMRFVVDIYERLLRFPTPDDKFILYAKRNYGEKYGDPQRCKTQPDIYGWNLVDLNSITWWCNDRIQIIPWHYVPAMWQLLGGPTLFKSHHWPFQNPRWPFECWANLGPLVGGDQNIDFLEEDVIAICKVAQDNGWYREDGREDTALSMDSALSMRRYREDEDEELSMQPRSSWVLEDCETQTR